MARRGRRTGDSFRALWVWLTLELLALGVVLIWTLARVTDWPVPVKAGAALILLALLGWISWRAMRTFHGASRSL